MPQPESFAKCACEHCGGRIEFPASAAGREIPCPHCKWPTLLRLNQPVLVDGGGGQAARKGIYVGMAIAILAAGAGAYYYFGVNKKEQAAGISGQSANSNLVASAPKPTPPPDPWHGLYAGGVKLEKAENGDLVYAVGTLTNTTTRERFGVKVQLEVLDEHRHKIGVATDYTEVIEPGKAWKFRAMVIDKEAKGAILIGVKEQ